MNYHLALKQIQDARAALDRLEAQLRREHPANSLGSYNALDPEARVQDAFPGWETEDFRVVVPATAEEVAAYERHIRTRGEERELESGDGDVGEDT